MKRVSSAAIVFIAASMVAGALGGAFASGCGARGKDAPEGQERAQRPPLSSFMPIFIQLAERGDLDELTKVVLELQRTGQLKDLVDALDLACRTAGGEALKEILGRVLSDAEFRAFFKKDGPLQLVLEYPRIYELFDALHLLSMKGVVQNGVIPLLVTVVDSPLLRALKDADRDIIRSGAASAALGAIEGLASEKVEYPIINDAGEPVTVKAPALVPLLNMFVTLADGKELSVLSQSVISLMIDERVAPLFAVAGGLASEIDKNPSMARRIIANLGHGFLAVDRSQMVGLRGILDHMIINSVPVKAVDHSILNISLPGQLRALVGPDGAGGARLITVLRNLGPSVIEKTAPVLAEPFARHCLDPKPADGGDGLAHPDEDTTDNRESCFMEMLHMAQSMYGKEIISTDDIRELGAELITSLCSSKLHPDDPEWATAVDTASHGKQPLLPNFPGNVLKVFLENVGNRVRCLDAQGKLDDCAGYEPAQRRYSPAISVGYASYINCVLHSDVPSVYFSAGLEWDVDVIGFAALEYIARRGGMDLVFPIVYEMQRHPDGTDHIWDLSNLVAMLYGVEGTELGRYWRVASSFFNYPAPEESLVADITRLVDVLLGMEVQYGNDRREAAAVLVDSLVALNEPGAGGAVPIVDTIAIPALELISRNIDADLELAIPGIAAAMEKPEYRVEGIFTLLAAALTEETGKVSYTDYIDPASAHFRPAFSAEATELVDTVLPRLRDLAAYTVASDADGTIAAMLAYSIQKGVMADVLTLFEHLLSYDEEHRLLDFTSRLLRGGVVTTVNDILDVLHERGLAKTTVPIFTMFCEREVWPEFLDVVYQVLPIITLGNTE